MTEKLCKICQQPFDVNEKGRPAAYCSTSCRRAAEARRARIQRHLEWLAREQVRLKLKIGTIEHIYPGDKGRLAILAAEIRSAELELMSLLGVPDEV